jgi:hypothetical protein
LTGRKVQRNTQAGYYTPAQVTLAKRIKGAEDAEFKYSWVHVPRQPYLNPIQPHLLCVSAPPRETNQALLPQRLTLGWSWRRRVKTP